MAPVALIDRLQRLKGTESMVMDSLESQICKSKIQSDMNLNLN